MQSATNAVGSSHELVCISLEARKAAHDSLRYWICGGDRVLPSLHQQAQQVLGNPAILEAVVVAQSDPVQGQVPFAFYQIKEGAMDPGASALREWLRTRVDAPSTPDAFVRLERWPMTSQGKLDRSRLTWLAETGGEGL